MFENLGKPDMGVGWGGGRGACIYFLYLHCVLKQLTTKCALYSSTFSNFSCNEILFKYRLSYHNVPCIFFL